MPEPSLPQNVDVQITPGTKLTLTVSVDRASIPPGMHATGVQALSDTVGRNAEAHKHVRAELDTVLATQDELVEATTKLERQVASLRATVAALLPFVAMPSEIKTKLLENMR